MWTKVITWLFGTAMGRGVLLGASMSIGAFVSWYAFKTHYYDTGFQECQLGRATDTNEAKVAQVEQNAANNENSTAAGKLADDEAAKVAAWAEDEQKTNTETADER